MVIPADCGDARLFFQLVEQGEINRHPHRLIPGAIRMQFVAGTTDGIVGDELGLHATGFFIEDHAVEKRKRARLPHNSGLTIRRND